MMIFNDRKKDGTYRLVLTVPEYHDLLAFLESRKADQAVLNLKYLIMAMREKA